MPSGTERREQNVGENVAFLNISASGQKVSKTLTNILHSGIRDPGNGPPQPKNQNAYKAHAFPCAGVPFPGFPFAGFPVLRDAPSGTIGNA